MRSLTNPIRLAALVALGASVVAGCAPTPGDPGTTTVPSTSVPVSAAIGGDYQVRYAVDSTASIRVSSNTITVTSGPGFRIEGANCTLPTGRVLAVLSGTGSHFTGTHWGFNTGTCESTVAYSSTADLNSDGSVTLTGPTGSHLFRKVANAPELAPDLPAVYDTTYGTAGQVTAHVSGDQLTLSVASPMRVEGGTCDMPVGRVLAIVGGTGLHRTGTHWGVNAGTCFDTVAYSSNVYVNSDRSLTVTGPFGPHLLVRRTSVPTLASVDPVGSYRAQYATAGTVEVRRSGTTYTASVGSGFTPEGLSCSLAPSVVLGSYVGTGVALSGTAWNFDNATCSQSIRYSSSMYVNSDGSLTVTGPYGPHLYAPA